MSSSAAPPRSRVPWALALAVGLASGLAGYVIRVAQVKRVPKQVVKVKRLTDMAGSEESPAISPDGKSVAFVALTGGKRQIWTLPTSGGTPQMITKDDVDHYDPRWSPDSNSLIFYTYAPGTIWEIAAQGGAARRMVDSLAPGDLSHDGKRLAFVRIQGDSVELTVCLRDGSDSHTVTKLGADFYTHLRWAPDDKKVAFLEADDIHSRVLVVNASGGDVLPVESGVRRPQGFTWAPDNSGLIVSTTDGELWFIPRKENDSPSQLTFGELSYESPDISRDGKLVVSRSGLYGGSQADIVLFSGLKW